jgi:hypothetical protein
LGACFIVRCENRHWARLWALLAFAPLISGCTGAMPDFNAVKDAEWFSRPGRLFIRNVSIDAPPLSPNEPVRADDLVSADGACPGMTPPGSPADANALTDGPAGAPPQSRGSVALGHTECDVVRGIGAPDSVNISSNAGGERVAVVTWTRGGRAGIYTFNGGRLSSVERGAEPVSEPKAAKSKPKKKPAAT